MLFRYTAFKQEEAAIIIYVNIKQAAKLQEASLIQAGTHPALEGLRWDACDDDI